MDCVVVGAGIVGCATANELARRGHDVVVLDGATVGAGASSGPGWRGVRANGRDERELALARRAHELWADIGYRQTGHLQLTERESDLVLFERRADAQTRAGVASRTLHRRELADLEPDASDAVVGALWCERDGIADHTATTAALAAAAQTAGADIREQTRVVDVRARGDRTEVVTATGEVVQGDAVVIATNATTTELVEVPVFAVYPQVIMTERLERSPVRHLVGHEHRPLALKTVPTGEVMVSGGRLGRDGHIEPGAVDTNMADAVAVFPALASVSVAIADASRAESVTPDMIPIIDRIPGTANAFVAAGWSGHGWALAPAVGEALANWIVTGRRPSSLDPFGLQRFAASGSQI